jgi:hypothetical protein
VYSGTRRNVASAPREGKRARTGPQVEMEARPVFRYIWPKRSKLWRNFDFCSLWHSPRSRTWSKWLDGCAKSEKGVGQPRMEFHSHEPRNTSRSAPDGTWSCVRAVYQKRSGHPLTRRSWFPIGDLLNERCLQAWCRSNGSISVKDTEAHGSCYRDAILIMRLTGCISAAS